MESEKNQSIGQAIPLQGVLNARELGGIRLQNGRQVRHNCLIRSGRLANLTEQDKKLLSETWHVTDIIDLRNRQEIAEYPDPELGQAVWHWLSLFSEGKQGITREESGRTPENISAAEQKESFEKAVNRRVEQKTSELYWEQLPTRAQRIVAETPQGCRRLLLDMYPDMVTQEYCVSQIRGFFDLLLAHEEGAVLWHCTSGKDRTGVTAALLLWVLGASWDTIAKEYLQTNVQTGEYRRKVTEELRKNRVPEHVVGEMAILEAVDLCYLTGCFDAIVQRHGSVDLFLRNALELTPEKQRRLQEKYSC